ncbi:F0F1 ATP synthase subunit delta [Vibrio sp. SS-MA-C1-2]|uniref:F0F1 ATP synthase subunit delta n=1 Tax=Vibrio sp. SS-MA-C1-2 TaxID=2908646 RepID=UPI001F1F491B|nr:F0F1 ATP synthase subunit delta [Vibrio sp. SS-MA-C1-2]UJF19337.1 F0F1 ATP synthase subunit delta [Vibrio sp. SS-MA-C1-2]
MSEMTTIARPYAKAAFDFAVENKSLDKWAEMLAFSAEVAKNETVHQLLDGALTPEKVAEIFVSVCGEQLNEHGQNFIKVMAESGRLLALPEVSDQFILLWQELKHEMDVDVISAVALSKAQEKEIGAKLEKRLERKIKLNCSVDEALVAGIIIRAGDLVIDNSVRTKLARLNDALQS